MSDVNEEYEEDYNEYDEFDDDDDEGGLSGFAVLMIGLLMFGAFVSVTMLAYQRGLKNGAETPYVAADPEPIKIEQAGLDTPVRDREVYDALDGDTPEPVTVLAEGPEEPVDRNVIDRAADTVGSLADDAAAAAAEVSAEVEERIASLAEEDASIFDNVAESNPAPTRSQTVTAPTPTSISRGGATSGSHVVQVGAFRSNDEAASQWNRLRTRLGDFADGKTYHVEEADLGDRGVYHRLRIGPFTSSEDASTYCAGLKERGQDCLIKSL